MKRIIKKTSNYGTEAVKTILHPFLKKGTTTVLHPFTVPTQRIDPKNPFYIQITDYSSEHLHCQEYNSIEEVIHFREKNSITWLNLEGRYKEEVETLSQHFDIHPLIQEDIMSYGQRPKIDEVRKILFVLINMLFYHNHTHTIEQEQIGIVLGKQYVISFQEDAKRDVFDPLREKLKSPNSKVRQYPEDYLLYCMIDLIVDSYFSVIESIGNSIEIAEDELLNNGNKKAFQKITLIRKNLIIMKRNTTPVRDLVAAIIRSDNDLLEDNTTKYYKDVYDHIIQANDLVDNYREIVNALQDMYFNNMNLKMNEVMKTLAILTTIMAPATVIGGIFGMNFEIIPYSHNRWGFYGTVLVMIAIPLFMMVWFGKRGWFQNNSNDENGIS
jgi:magnesium transporter